MLQTISKSQFKPRALEYLRQVESGKKTLLITHLGKPVIKVIPYVENVGDKLKVLRGSLISFKRPTDPVGVSSWEGLK